ncbi:MAG: hypothetical protein K5793_03655 [Nitrosarchaeum sp.]|nr:hypothetical protein [Nitrosarchaeum sp.]
MHENKRPFRKFVKKEKKQTTEEKIKSFILRNSRNGYYTKISTLPYKFEISEDRAWEIAGALLGEGDLESIHDEHTGEMKLCEAGKIYDILSQEQKRKKEKAKEYKKKHKSSKEHQKLKKD